MPSIDTRTPSALRVPEEKLALAGASGAAVAAVLCASVFMVVGGVVPAASAGAGAGLVAVLSLATLPLYRFGAAAGNEMVVAMSMAAMGMRMMIGLIVFAALSKLTTVPMATFATGLAVGLVVSIIAEMTSASRDPRFFWVDATSTQVNSGTERQHA